ncbi:MAG: Ig-like domain-containing protein [Candidatus Sericytochromatia bacterium]
MKKNAILTTLSIFLLSCNMQINGTNKTSDDKKPVITENTNTIITENKNTNSTIAKNGIVEEKKEIPSIKIKNDDFFYMGSVNRLIADLKDEKGNKNNDVIWQSSDESIAKIQNGNFLYALKAGKVTITATSSKNPSLKESISILIKEKEINSIAVKSIKDGYIIAQTGMEKKVFNFDTNPNSWDSFVAEVEYKNGDKTEQVIWETNENDFIEVFNGVIKGKKYGSVDINIRTVDNVSQNVIFTANFLKNLDTGILDSCYNSSILPKYLNYDYKLRCVYDKIIRDPDNGIYPTTFNGKVYDTAGVPVDGATVTAKSVDPTIKWVGEAQQTQSGSYIFRNAPVTTIEISVKKDGWTTRTRIVNTRSSLPNYLNTNVFEFGNGPAGTDPNNLYAIQDEPEVTSLKINGKIATDSDTGSTSVPNPRIPETVPGANLTGISSDSLTIEMTFSEPVRRDDVENYFKVLSTKTFDTRKSSFTIDRNLSAVSFVWSADDTAVTVKTSKPILANKNGEEARYMVDFTQAFRDKTDKPSKEKRTFRFSASKINDFHVFSVKNQDQDPYITNIQAVNGIESDFIKVTFSKPMDVINQTVPQALLADPTNIFTSNDVARQLFAFNTNNGEKANNSTVLGFRMPNSINTSTSGNSLNFRPVYVIGRLKKSDLDYALLNKTGSNLYLNGLGGDFILGSENNEQYGGSKKPLKSSKVEGNTITLEFSPNAFDKDDRVILSANSNISMAYNDKVNSVVVGSLQPTLGSGIGDFIKVTDPSGRPLDGGTNSCCSGIMDINNAQKVAIAN